VNVRLPRPPRWLRDRLVAALDRIGGYPTAAHDAAARSAAAVRHGREPEEVLILNGAAEGFALLPALRPALAAVVHPGFTEPEAALRDAGVPVHRVQLDPAGGYRLDPALVPAEADLVVIGNPTNPTSVLHPATAIARLARPGRTLVVDEAFMDAVPGEPETLASQRLPGLLVLRSLTKTWALAGLRAGYALAEPALLARLARHRPPWPVHTLALEAVIACSEPMAVAEAAGAAALLDIHRDHLATALAALPGIQVHRPARAPFLLIEVRDGARIRETLRHNGFAVRRADTFPGLTPDHLRLAVRPPAQCAALVAALRDALDPGPPAGRTPGLSRLDHVTSAMGDV
jgi:histidinol-phosphate aminotransferase